jgi:hypothetical protein
MAEIREGAFLREALELAAIERVATTITEEQLVLLKRNLRIQEALMQDGDTAGFHQMDAELHETDPVIYRLPAAGIARRNSMDPRQPRASSQPANDRAECRPRSPSTRPSSQRLKRVIRRLRARQPGTISAN